MARGIQSPVGIVRESRMDVPELFKICRELRIFG